jgi:hypothetical protein
MSIQKSLFLLLSTALLFSCSASGKKHLVLIAGSDSHGPGAHEFLAGCTLLKKRLDAALGEQLETTLVAKDWPEDTSVIEKADALVVYSDGRGKHPLNKHMEFIQKQIDRGMGIAFMHYACDVPGGVQGDAFKKWIGGHYDAKKSINPIWEMNSVYNKENDVCRGCKPFTLVDEWYFAINFENGATRKAALQGIPSDATRGGAMHDSKKKRKSFPHVTAASGQKADILWTVERADGGRGFGFTGGHFHANWENDQLRKLVLNSIAWLCKINVPEQGIESGTPDAEEMKHLTKMDRGFFNKKKKK